MNEANFTLDSRLNEALSGTLPGFVGQFYNPFIDVISILTGILSTCCATIRYHLPARIWLIGKLREVVTCFICLPERLRLATGLSLDPIAMSTSTTRNTISAISPQPGSS